MIVCSYYAYRTNNFLWNSYLKKSDYDPETAINTILEITES